MFAARDFSKDEIDESAPFFLAADPTSPYIIHSSLQDYIYGYTQILEDTDESINLGVIAWGMGMWYNHHSTHHNVEWKMFGRKPSVTNHNVQAVGFTAERDIKAGEELLSTYGHDDEGTAWFQQRNIPLADESSISSDSTTKIPPNDINLVSHEYCSKMHAGVDQWVYQHRLRVIQPPDFPYVIPIERLVPPSSSFAQARHRQHVQDYEKPDYP